MGRTYPEALPDCVYARILELDDEALTQVPHLQKMPYDQDNLPKPGDIFILTRDAWKHKRLFSQQTREKGEDGVGQVFGSKPKQAWNDNNHSKLHLSEIAGPLGEQFMLQKSFLGQRSPPKPDAEQRAKKAKHGCVTRANRVVLPQPTWEPDTTLYLNVAG